MRFGAFGGDLVRAGGRHRQALLVADVDRDSLAAALGQPYALIVEVVDGEAPTGEWAAVAVPADGFYLSLTTGTIFGLQVAALVSRALFSRGVISAELRSVVELCLQEAVANAIVHGNLGIASTAKDHPEGYRVFSSLVTERLADRALRRRRVDLFTRWSGKALDISVVDAGSGFDVAAIPAEVDGAARSGRGFIFMRALAGRVAITDGGRCTSLRFDL